MSEPSESSIVRTVLVTGANRGMGLGLAHHYLKSNWQVIATKRQESKTDDLCALVDEAGERLMVEDLDSSSEESIQQLGSRLVERGVQLDLLINNAAISIEEPFGGWTSKLFADLFMVNATGPALMAQALNPLLKEGAKLINLSSGMASMEMNINPDGALDAYAMSKAALNMISLRLASKLKARCITVAAISPGWVKTDMGGPDAPTPIDEAVEQVTRTIEELQLEQTGAFLSESGEVLPW